MSRSSLSATTALLLLLATVVLCFIHSVHSQDIPITQWKGTWISDFVQSKPKYYQASASILNCSQAKFIINVTSGSAVNVAIKKNAVASFDVYDYKAVNVRDSTSYVYRGLQSSDQIYVIVNGAISAWNLYSLNFDNIYKIVF